jgi:hypothetical protein
MKAVHHSFTAYQVSVALGVILGATALFYLVRKFVLASRYHHKELRALGVFREQTKTFVDPKTGAVRDRVVKATLKVRWQKNRLIFFRYNLAFSQAEFERLKPNLEHIFRKKIEAISSEKSFLPWSQPKIILHTEAFKEVVLIEEKPKNLKAGEYWLGLTSLAEDLVIDTVEKFQFSLGILSQAGGGKGNALYTAVSTLCETWIEKTGELPFRLLFLDSKGTDYLSLIKKYQKWEARTLNPIFIDELKIAVELLSAYKKEVDEYRRFLAQKEISVAHWYEIKTKHPELPPIPKPYLLVLDETAQYLSPRPTIKLSKDSSDEEKELYERYQLEAKLASLLNSILQLFRSSGVVVLLANQASREGDLTIDRTNIRTVLVGQQNAVMSRLLTGSDIATDSTLVRGKFIFAGDGRVVKVQVPWVLGLPEKYKRGRK